MSQLQNLNPNLEKHVHVSITTLAKLFVLPFDNNHQNFEELFASWKEIIT